MSKGSSSARRWNQYLGKSATEDSREAHGLSASGRLRRYFDPWSRHGQDVRTSDRRNLILPMRHLFPQEPLVTSCVPALSMLHRAVRPPAQIWALASLES